MSKKITDTNESNEVMATFNGRAEVQFSCFCNNKIQAFRITRLIVCGECGTNYHVVEGAVVYYPKIGGEQLTLF